MRRHRQTAACVIVALLLISLPTGVAYAVQPSDSGAATARLVSEALRAFAHAGDPRFPIGYQATQRWRSEVGDQLRKLSPAAQGDVIKQLVRPLTAPDSKRRATAAAVIGQLRPNTAMAIRPLLNAMKTPDLEVQTQAAQALSATLPSPLPSEFTKLLVEDLWPRLITELHAPDPRARMRGLVTLSLLANSIPAASGPLASLGTSAVLNCLHDPDPRVRAAATQTLGGLRDSFARSARPLTELIPGVKSTPTFPSRPDPEPWVIAGAITALGHMGALATPAVPALAGAMRSSQPGVREAARNALGELREHASAAVPLLAQMLHDSDAGLRAQAAETLARMGDNAQIAFPDLIEATADRDPDTQRFALWAISNLGSQAQVALAPLRKRIHSVDPFERISAAAALGRLNPVSESATSILMEAAQDTHPEVQSAVGQALADLGALAESAAPRLRQMLRDSRAENRRLAALVLGRMSKAALPTLPELVTMASGDPDLETRLAALQAVGLIHESPTPGQPFTPRLPARSYRVLLDGLKAPDPRIKQAALTALQAVPPLPPVLDGATITDVTVALTDPSPAVRESAIGLIVSLANPASGTVNPAIDASLRTLVTLLKDPDLSVARRVVLAMSSLAPRMPGSVPAIMAIAQDRKANDAARMSAVKALCRLEKYAKPAIPVLANLVRTAGERADLRAHAAFALRIIGDTPPDLDGLIARLLKSRIEYFQTLDF